ncbi:MAG TPA: hypothetical protein VFI31_08410 [Pirellulales bacterium]|nr:hypothetical protein [Pirellulales bacterium]
MAVLLGAAVLFLVGSGCSPPPRTVEVVGRVTYNGAPVEGAIVVFFGEKYGDDLPAAGATDGTGHYELRTYFSAHDMPLGAIPNDYVVVIQKFKYPDTVRAQNKMSELAGLKGDLKRYIAEEAIHDLWPEGVPDGWPDGYIPSVTQIPRHIFENKERREKLTRLLRGIPLLPLRYADPSTTELRASVERSDGPLTFDFDLTGEIDEAAPRSVAEFQLGPPE